MDGTPGAAPEYRVGESLGAGPEYRVGETIESLSERSERKITIRESFRSESRESFSESRESFSESRERESVSESRERFSETEIRSDFGCYGEIGGYCREAYREPDASRCCRRPALDPCGASWVAPGSGPETGERFIPILG